MRLLAIDMLYLLWTIPVFVALLAYAAWRRKQALLLFAESDLLRHISNTVSASSRRWKAVLLVAAFASAVFALARPAWNPVEQEVERRGRDVVFLLDVSKSMLAEDLAPNRLERAKLAILDSVERLDGDRVALIAFAGAAVVKCPPTHDYGFFRMAVEDVSFDSVSRGGTLIGDAIRTAIDQVFNDKSRGHRDLVLITDGEDHESFPVEAAQQLGDLGIRLVAIGLGDENQGRRIPITDKNGRLVFLQYGGEEVWSRLDADTLRKMVNVTPGGRYLNVATGTIDFGDVYVKLIASADKAELGTATYRQYEEKFQIFLTVAFILLLIEIVIRERKPAARIAAAFVCLLAVSSPAAAQSARSLVAEGNDSYHEERFPEALDRYQQAEKLKPDSSHIWFNKGNALYQQGNFTEAMDAYEQAAIQGQGSRLEALSKYNQGNAAFRYGAQQGQADPTAGINSLRKSVQLYQDALQSDSSVNDARHNIEVARRLIQQLLEQQQQQQQNQDNKDPDKDQQQQQQQQQQKGDEDQKQDQQEQQQSSGDEEEQQKQQQQQSQQEQQEQQQAKPQAAEKAEDILDEEREKKLERQLRAVVGIKPVDTDW